MTEFMKWDSDQPAKNELIIRYGKDVLESEYFSGAKQQVHHLRSNVASHSVNTAIVCIVLYRFLTVFHIKLNLSTLIITALAHDLGMIGREQKFSSNLEAYREHPRCSAQILQEIRPDIDQQSCEVIASHMYPAGGAVPATKEAWVLCLADKCAACTDWFRHYDVIKAR